MGGTGSFYIFGSPDAPEFAQPMSALTGKDPSTLMSDLGLPNAAPVVDRGFINSDQGAPGTLCTIDARSYSSRR